MMTTKVLVKSLIPFLVIAGSLPAEAAMLPTSAPTLFSSPAEAKKAEEYVYAFAVKLIAEKKFVQAATILRELVDSGSELPTPDEYVRLLNQLDDHVGIIQYYEKNRTRAFAGETYGYIGIAYIEQKDAVNAGICFSKAAAGSSADRQAYTVPARYGKQQTALANSPLPESYGQSSSAKPLPAASASPAVVSGSSTGVVSPYDLPPSTYQSLIDDLLHVGQTKPPVDKKVNLSAELRHHYAVNSGSEGLAKDNSGLRLYLGADTALNQDWRFYAQGEVRRDIKNYNNMFDLSRYYVEGKTGETRLTAGKFGYLMADGNIYDSGFTGVRADFGKVVKYTAAAGKTNDNKNAMVTTAQYSDYDYDLEAGAYHYQLNDGSSRTNTIKTLSGTYRFSNFSLGGSFLNASIADTKGNKNGYVLSFDYGDLKTWRPHTYSLFARYYNQPRHTYMDHGMNGPGNRMEGFKGYGFGANYALQENLTFGVEHYILTDKVSNEKANTWWTYLTHYFSNK